MKKSLIKHFAITASALTLGSVLMSPTLNAVSAQETVHLDTAVTSKE